MGQTDLIRTEFLPRQVVTSSIDSAVQLLAFTRYARVGDSVDIYAMNSGGCRIGAALATDLSLLDISPNAAFTFDTTVDTSTSLPAGADGWYAIITNIDDGQEAIDRLYRSGADEFGLTAAILAQSLDDPGAGQGTYDVASVSLWRAGDEIDIVADEGLVDSANIDSISVQADEANNKSIIVLDESIDTSAYTNPTIVNKSITYQVAIERLSEDLDQIDKPVENEFIGLGDCQSVYETDNLFLAGTSKLLLDGRRLRLGTPGTRATLSNGATNAQLDLTSMILGLDGNDIDFEMLDPASSSSALSVTVTGDFDSNNFKVSVSLETDGGSALISTAQDVADAINADADAKRLLQVIYGGDGTGVQAALTAAPLTGGLDDGSGDYAEIPQLFENQISLTGYKWVSLWIIPSDNNRLNKPPRNSEELVIDYRQALYNA